MFASRTFATPSSAPSPSPARCSRPRSTARRNARANEQKRLAAALAQERYYMSYGQGETIDGGTSAAPARPRERADAVGPGRSRRSATTRPTASPRR